MDGGNDGLDVIKKVIYKSKYILKINGILALEIGNGQSLVKKSFKNIKENNYLKVKEIILRILTTIERCLIAVLNKYE